MSETFIIEQNVPIPRGRGSKAAAFQRLNVGDSFEFKHTGSRASVYSQFSHMSKKLGWKHATRKVGENMFRVWRTA